MQIFFQKNNKDRGALFDEIEKACKGLIYISETDAPVVAFAGAATGAVTGEIILQQAAENAEGPIEEISFDDLFARLSAIKDWFGELEKEKAERFRRLKELLEENLRDRKAFKTGTVQKRIFAVGIDKEGCLMGVTTRAVET